MTARPVFYGLFAAFIALLGTAAALADSRPPIGHITQLDKNYWALRIDGKGGERDATPQGKIFEKDVIQTVAEQHLTVMLVDGTELVIGPSTRLVFKNWTDRDSDGHCVRVIQLLKGLVKAKVRKIYSQDEPFVIANHYGVVAVRGTEFVVEAGMTGNALRRLSESEAEASNNEVEVHTLEGDVHLAKTMSGLSDSSQWVSVTAGQTSMVREYFSRPQAVHSFDVQKYASYLAKIVPSAQVVVVKSTSNSQRAELAENIGGKAETSSPSNPAYARAQTAKSAGRSLASVDDGSATESAPVTSRTRLRGSPSPLTAEPVGSIVAGMGPQTTDGVRPAFYGGDALNAASNYNAVQMAHQNTDAIQANLNGGQGMVIGQPPAPLLNGGVAPIVVPTQPGVKIPTGFPTPAKGSP